MTLTQTKRSNHPATERKRILDNGRAVRDRIRADLADAERWNLTVRRPDEEPIDPDPVGELRRLLAALDEWLANDPGHGRIAPLNFQRSN